MWNAKYVETVHAMLAAANAPDPYLRAAFYLFLLVLGLGFCLFVLLRFSRRYRERLLHKPPKPTAVPDIWAMHKVPEDDAADEDKRGQEP
jgi:hypothetical protein